MEYAERGAGPPLLAVHGTPGGCDQGLLVGEVFRAGGFRVIAPSRPGYLGTPLATGATCEDQADAMAGLLDTLGLDRVAVLGASGGGPSSYLLAARHPDRVASLLQIDAISMRYVDKHPTMQRLNWSRGGVATTVWLLDHFPGPLIKLVVGTPAEDTPPRDDLVRAVRALTLSGAGWSKRRDGYTNDMSQFDQLHDLPLADITCPTLIIHGSADWDVEPRHAEHAHEQIADSRLEWIAGGSHLGFSVSPAVQAEALTWLRSAHT
jgi:pimeloyl-ACP methyl ester carboxylesterase